MKRLCSLSYSRTYLCSLTCEWWRHLPESTSYCYIMLVVSLCFCSTHQPFAFKWVVDSTLALKSLFVHAWIFSFVYYSSKIRHPRIISSPRSSSLWFLCQFVLDSFYSVPCFHSWGCGPTIGLSYGLLLPSHLGKVMHLSWELKMNITCMGNKYFCYMLSHHSSFSYPSI